MSKTTGKEHELAIRIAGTIDKSFNVSLTSVNNSLKKTLAAVDQDFTRLDRAFGSIMGVGKKCFSAIATASGAAAAAVGTAVASCTSAAAEFEDQMSSVVKYVNGLADATGKISDALVPDADGNKTYADNYREIKSALLELSTQIPMTAGELAQLAAAAGQSGYSIDELFRYDSDGNLSGFLKDTAMMGAAMDISAEQAGEWAAKWENAFSMNHEEVMVLADQINYLGANSATTAAEIAQAVNDAASLGQIAGIDVSTTAALADAMLATGVNSAQVATSIKRTITNLSKGASATEAMKDQWKELGFTAEGVAKAMQEDSIGTLKEVFSAIGGLPDYKQVAALSTLLGQYAIEGGAKMVGNMQVFQDALDMVGDPDKYNGSMAREFAIKVSTSENIDTMLSNAVQAMKINFGDSFLPIKKEYSQKLIGFINEMAEKMTGFNNYLSGANGLSKWIKNIETKLPTFLRKFKKYAQPVFSGFMDAGQWIAKHGDGIISVLAGIGGAMAAYKVTSGFSHAIQAILSLGGLSPVTWVILAATAAIGGLIGAYTAIKRHEQDLINQNLADHFGSIALSMEDIQKAAEHILGAESLEGVRKALEEFDELDGISASMQEVVSELDKMNWKLAIGMELTADENESYKQAIDTYIESAQEYALQTQYAVSLNLKFAFSDDDLEGQNVVTKVKQFYQDKYSELEDLGRQLNEALTGAFEDGLLEFEETEAIANIQRQMAAVEEAIAVEEFETNIYALAIKKGELGGLTPESFQDLQYGLAEQEEAMLETRRKSYARNLNSLDKSYAAGALTEEEYLYGKKSAQEEYLAYAAEIQARGANVLMETIMSQYADELGPAIDSYMLQMQEIIASYAEHGNAEWMDEAGRLWEGMLYKSNNSDLDNITGKSIGQLLEGMLPIIEDMKSTVQQLEAMGDEVPEDIRNILSNFALLDALSMTHADSDSLEHVLGEQLVKSEYYESLYKDVVEQLNSSQYHVPDAIMEGIRNVRPAVEGMYAWTQEAIDEYYSQEFQATANVNITLNPVFRNGSVNIPLYSGLNLPIDKNADGGIIRNKELSWLAEEGPEAVIPLDGSRNAISLWEKAGQLLGMESAFDGLDIDGGGSTVKVEYKPTLNFYGEAPSKSDLTDALHISQDEFESYMDNYMEKWIKTQARVSY